MSLIAFEGFNDGLAHLGKSNWTWVSTGGGTPYDTSNQRNGDACALSTGSNSRSWWYAIPTALRDPELVLGVGVRTHDLSGPAEVISFWSSTTGVRVGTTHVWLKFKTDQTVDVMRGASTTIASSIASYIDDVWDYWEIRVLLAGSSTGQIEVWKNGALVYQNLAVTTLGSGSDTECTAISLVQNGGGGGSAQIYFDDFYLVANDGSGVEGALGDCKVETLYPNADGNLVQWTGVGTPGGANDFNYVDEVGTTPNITDYLTSSTPGDKSQFALTDLVTASGIIYGVQPCHYASKSDAGARTIKTALRVSGSNSDGPTEFTPGTSWEGFAEILEEKPGGGAYTVSLVNSMEVGTKVET